ncbi:MAG: hypothetical protein ACREGR_00885 [Minisyncoccia bacterium]
MTATIDKLHSKAKRAVASGEACFREAADHLAEARKLGATMRQSAKAIGKSPSWVNRLLLWRDGGFKNSPFGPQAKAKRARSAARVQSPAQTTGQPSAPEKIAKWQAQQARAEAMALIFAPTPSPVPAGLRQKLIAALMMLGGSHPAERARARLGMTWDELVVPAAAESIAELAKQAKQAAA